ncbi:MAG TPA: DUF805 domain-containing protein, partial [Pyrinomonadaceae bacterium]|nr:DUF805 domain-containing protein [Pyrinomonadaceae bacterium]
MVFTPSDLWRWQGRVGRTKYLAMGATLFAGKHLLDRFVAAAVFDRRWSLFNYWVFADGAQVDETPQSLMRFYATLLLLALPFIWVGVVLTLRRLRDAGLPLWLVILFFVPFLNLIFFLLLAVLPGRERVPRGGRATSFFDRLIPRGAFGSAVLGIVITAAPVVALTLLSVQGLNNYGWGLFVGLPFALGLSSVLVYGYHAPRPLGKCVLVALLSVTLVSGVLIGVAIEGVICMAMAAPLGAAVAVLGGLVGYAIQHHRSLPARQDYAVHACTLLLFALPAMMLLEHSAQLAPTLRAVETSVEVDAPPAEVWSHLVAFSELPPPAERIFHTGIAYPLRAEIDGHGVGAVRHCVFTTGAFVEPIEVWDEPRLLRFGVSAQPPVMDEMSPYPHLHPPHLDGYLQSRRGQFQLETLPDGRTRLTGTTWYQNSF